MSRSGYVDELCQLRDTPAPQAYTVSEDPERQPEANPLRHLAKAFRSLTDVCVCLNCVRTCAAWRMGSRWSCCYCYGRRNNAGPEARFAHKDPSSSDLERRIASATPKEAECREVWDWDCWSTSGAES